MAEQITVALVDDLDGSTEADTVTFELDRVGYEIDLSPGNAERLRQALAPYVENARRLSAAPKRKAAGRRESGKGQAKATKAVTDGRGRRPTRPAKARGTTHSPTDDLAYSAEVRQWAVEQGHQVGIRGRLPTKIVTAYKEAQEAAAPPARTGGKSRSRKTATA